MGLLKVQRVSLQIQLQEHSTVLHCRLLSYGTNSRFRTRRQKSSLIAFVINTRLAD